MAANVVWGPDPHLVDWEFWRYGDPAEDLAYLAEANGLDDAALAAVAGGHGDPAAAGRIEGWRPAWPPRSRRGGSRWGATSWPRRPCSAWGSALPVLPVHDLVQRPAMPGLQ